MADTHHLLARFNRAAEYAAIMHAIGAGIEDDDSRDNPIQPGTLPGDPFAARGVPICGVKGGLGSATAGSVPHRDAPSLRRTRSG
jgi:hypothetical protein